jgi:hypothetical protein
MSVNPLIDINNPFDLDNRIAYENWRDKKLEHYPDKAEQLIVEINDPMWLTNSEHKAIFDRCDKSNMAIYISKTAMNPDKRIATGLATSLVCTAWIKIWGRMMMA